MPKSREDKRLEEIREWFEDGWVIRSKRDEAWWRAARIYNNTFSTAVRAAGRANVWIPKSFSTIETDTARYVVGLFSGDKFVSMKGLDKPSQEKKLGAEQLFNAELTKAQIFSAVARLIKATNIYGTMAMVPGYKILKRKFTARKPITVAGMKVADGERISKEKIVYRGLSLEPYSPWNITPWPGTCRNENEAVAIILEDWITPQCYQKKVADGIYKETAIKNLQGDWQWNRNLTRLNRLGYPAPREAEKLIRRWIVLTCDSIEIVLNQQFLAMEADNPMDSKPVVISRKHFDPDSFFAMGNIQPHDRIQFAINSIFNQILNWNNVVVNPHLFYRSGVEADLLISYPGARTPLPDPSRDVKWFQPPSLGADTFQILALLNQFFDESSGVHDLQRGQVSGPLQATIGSILSQNADIRTRFDVSMFEKETLTPLMHHCLNLLSNFSDDLPVELPYGGEFMMADKSVYEGVWDFYFRGSTVSSAEDVKRVTLQNLFTLFANFPFMQTEMDMVEFGKAIFERHEIPEYERFFKAPAEEPGPADELMQELEASNMEQQAMAGNGKKLPQKNMGQPTDRFELLRRASAITRPQRTFAGAQG